MINKTKHKAVCMTKVTDELQNNTHTHKPKPLVWLSVLCHLERGWKGSFVTDFCLWDVQTVIPLQGLLRERGAGVRGVLTQEEYWRRNSLYKFTGLNQHNLGRARLFWVVCRK